MLSFRLASFFSFVFCFKSVSHFRFHKRMCISLLEKKMVRNERFNLFWFQIEANKNRTRAAKCVCCMLFAVLYFRFNVLFRMTKYRAKDWNTFFSVDRCCCYYYCCRFLLFFSSFLFFGWSGNRLTIYLRPGKYSLCSLSLRLARTVCDKNVKFNQTLCNVWFLQ